MGWIDEAEAIARHDIRNRAPISNFGYRAVLEHRGDLVLAEVAVDQWLDECLEAAGRTLVPMLVVVDGSLQSGEGLTLPDDPLVCLFVRGDLRVPWIRLGYSQAILVEGDASITAAVVASGTSGELRVEGAATAPYVFDNGDNVISAGQQAWTRVVHRQPGDLAEVCAALGLTGIDFDDPDSEPDMAVVEALLERAGSGR